MVENPFSALGWTQELQEIKDSKHNQHHAADVPFGPKAEENSKQRKVQLSVFKKFPFTFSAVRAKQVRESNECEGFKTLRSHNLR